MSIELCDSTVSSTSDADRGSPCVMSPAIGSADGITPTDNRPDSERDVFRSVSISCCSDLQLSRMVCAHFRTRSPSGVNP